MTQHIPLFPFYRKSRWVTVRTLVAVFLSGLALGCHSVLFWCFFHACNLVHCCWIVWSLHCYQFFFSSQLISLEPTVSVALETLDTLHFGDCLLHFIFWCSVSLHVQLLLCSCTNIMHGMGMTVNSFHVSKFDLAPRGTGRGGGKIGENHAKNG